MLKQAKPKPGSRSARLLAAGATVLLLAACAVPPKSMPCPAGTQDLLSINNNMGFWLHITSNGGNELLSLGTGTEPASTSIMLKTGWNLVGYPSATPRLADITLPPEVTMICRYNGASAYGIETLPLASVTMSEGNAYWVYTPITVQWDVDW